LKASIKTGSPLAVARRRAEQGRSRDRQGAVFKDGGTDRSLTLAALTCVLIGALSLKAWFARHLSPPAAGGNVRISNSKHHEAMRRQPRNGRFDHLDRSGSR